MAQIAFSACIGPCDFSYFIFLLNLAWLLQTALLFPEIIFFTLWHSKCIFRSLTTLACGGILLVLLSGSPWVVMLCISCFFGVGTEYSVHWHEQGQFAALSAAWGHRMVGAGGQQGYLMQDDGQCLRGGIMNRLQSPLSLQHHSSAPALLLLETVWSNAWCSGLAVLCSGFIPSIFRDCFSFGLAMVCAFWWVLLFQWGWLLSSGCVRAK